MDFIVSNILTKESLITHITYYLKLFVIALLITWYLQYVWRKIKLYKHARKIPGPPTLPFIGNAHLLIGDGYGK